MVKGLDLFREHFGEFADRYVLIGGAACDLIMSNAGLPFRVTKDLDIVLCVETLDVAFAEAFWAFVAAGVGARDRMGRAPSGGIDGGLGPADFRAKATKD